MSSLPDRDNTSDIELKRKLQLLKGSNGEYVLSTITDLYALIDFIAQEANKAKRKYDELIMAVGNKYEGETRHETALRYIEQAEAGNDIQATADKRSSK